MMGKFFLNRNQTGNHTLAKNKKADPYILRFPGSWTQGQKFGLFSFHTPLIYSPTLCKLPSPLFFSSFSFLNSALLLHLFTFPGWFLDIYFWWVTALGVGSKVDKTDFFLSFPLHHWTHRAVMFFCPVAVAVLVAPLCQMLFNPVDCNPPGSSVHGIP